MDPWELRCPLARRGVGIIASACLLSSTAVAQPGTNYNPTSTTDAYGNARPQYLGRRPVGIFQNEVQRVGLRGYQIWGRRADRRGGFIPFALPGDALGRMQVR